MKLFLIPHGIENKMEVIAVWVKDFRTGPQFGQTNTIKVKKFPSKREFYEFLVYSQEDEGHKYFMCLAKRWHMLE